MQLTLTQEAASYIERKFGGQPYALILEYIDGDSPFNTHAISCQLFEDFRLVAFHVKHPDVKWQDYTLTFSTPIGDVYIKPQATMFLDSNTVVAYDANYLGLTLKGDSGILAPRLPLVIID